VMETAIRSAKVGEPADRALAELRECRCQSLPIMADGRLAGVLTLENVGEYVMIDAALRARPAAGP
ncbi:MAG TPA: CBS domain-containing protein, partial [Gemmatimonadales bacterium]|nr:CBS domain-containing protein [Gemmatimonadales bacterium]